MPKEPAAKQKERGGLASGKRRLGQERDADDDEDMMLMMNHGM